MPRWNYTLDLKDIFHNDTLTFEHKRDVIVERIRRKLDGVGTFAELADELGDTETVEDFDHVWSDFYDEADFHRVWVVTF